MPNANKYPMRFSDILLEYNAGKTIEAYGSRLLDRIRSGEDLAVVMVPNGLSDKESVEHLVDYFENTDPTRNNQYVVWITVNYIAKRIELEDLGRVAGALEEFEFLKTHKFFKKNPDMAALADINQHKGLKPLEDFLDAAQKRTGDLAKEASAKMVAQVRKESTFVVDDPDLLVVIPRTKLASISWGSGTRWCTATGSQNMFDTYNSVGPLYIVIDRKTNKKWQLHFEHRQFMDRADDPMDWRVLPDIFWEKIPIDLLLRISSLDIPWSFTSDKITTLRLLKAGFPEKAGQLAVDKQLTVLMWGYEDKESFHQVLKEASDESLVLAYGTAHHWDQGRELLAEIQKRTYDEPDEIIEGDGVFHFGSRADLLLNEFKQKRGKLVVQLLSWLFRGVDSKAAVSSFRRIPFVIYQKGDNLWLFCKVRGEILMVAEHYDHVRPFNSYSDYPFLSIEQRSMLLRFLR